MKSERSSGAMVEKSNMGSGVESMQEFSRKVMDFGQWRRFLAGSLGIMQLPQQS